MAEIKNTGWKGFLTQLKNQYRLVILNDNTFAEKFSLRLSPLGLIVLIGSITVLMVTMVISLVAFTPLREYIPGYGNVNDRKDIIALSNKTDSLENSLKAKEWYLTNLVNVFSGKVEGKKDKPPKDTTIEYKNINIKPSKEDTKLRNDIESNQLLSTSEDVSANKINGLSNYFFFSPVKGMISTSYNLSEEHFGTDIVAKENELIKATLDGTVVFAGFTTADGYVLQIQHGNNLMSVYKHNSSISKQVGDFVKAGEPIAVIGNTGENSKGMHLHFELWYNGFSINPQDYVVF